MRSTFDIATDKRTFTIVMSDIAEAVILSHFVNACRETAPGIFFSTMQLPMEQTLPALRTGAVDLAVGFIPALRSGVKQRFLFETDSVALARRGHPGVKQAAQSKANFLNERLAVARAEGTGHALVERTLRKHGLESRIAMRVPHFLALPTVVAYSDLIATGPRPLGLLVADAAPSRSCRTRSGFPNWSSDNSGTGVSIRIRGCCGCDRRCAVRRQKPVRPERST